MDESLKHLYSINKRKYKMCDETYSYYLMATIIVFAAQLISNNYSAEPLIPIAWILSSYLVFLGRKSQRKFNSDIAAETSKKAQNILARATCGDFPGPFILYLRPFRINDILKVKNPHRSRFSLSYFFFPPKYFLEDNIKWESLLAELLENWAPLVGLGTPNEDIGANLIEVKKWKKSVLALMEQATLIIIVPACSAGTKWEINMLKKGNYFSKCLFILPEELDPFKFTISKSWLTLNNSMKQLGIEIPEYKKKGIAFRLNENGTLKEKFSPFSVFPNFSILSFFSLNNYPKSKEIIGDFFSENVDNSKCTETDNELEELNKGSYDEDKDCMGENDKQISNILKKKNEKKNEWRQKLNDFRKNGYHDKFRGKKISFEEQVVEGFIEAVYCDKAIIPFIDVEMNTNIFEDSIKYFRLIKTIGKDVFVEIHQRNSEGENIRRCVKFVISGVDIMRIELLVEENMDKESG